MATSDVRPRLAPWQLISTILQGAFYLAYPFVIYSAHTRWATRGVGGVLLGLYAASFLIRINGNSVSLWQVVRQHAGVAALIIVAIVLDNRTLLLLLPMLVSLYLLATFGWSLRSGPPMIERFARLMEDDLPPFTLPYCRRVTSIWCVFLAANASAVAILTFSAPLHWWTLYTGVIFYLLMGLLVSGEFCFRKWWFRYYGDGPADRLFARLFPAESTANGQRSLNYAARREAQSSATSP